MGQKGGRESGKKNPGWRWKFRLSVVNLRAKNSKETGQGSHRNELEMFARVLVSWLWSESQLERSGKKIYLKMLSEWLVTKGLLCLKKWLCVCVWGRGGAFSRSNRILCWEVGDTTQLTFILKKYRKVTHFVLMWERGYWACQGLRC